MKRKPNNGAGPEPREAAGAADPGGAGERNAGGTSGQSVPKSKFRQKSNQEKAAASKLRMQSCSSSLVTLGNSTIGAVGASTYPCEDGDLLGAEATYCDLEAELSDYLDSYESTHDYDEYHFDLDEIEHDPLTAPAMCPG